MHPLLPSRQCFPHPQGQAPSHHTLYKNASVHHVRCQVSRLHPLSVHHLYNIQGYRLHFALPYNHIVNLRPQHPAAVHHLQENEPERVVQTHCPAGIQNVPNPPYTLYHHDTCRLILVHTRYSLYLFPVYNTPDFPPVHTQCLHNMTHLPNCLPAHTQCLHSTMHLPSCLPAQMYCPQTAHLPDYLPVYTQCLHNMTHLPDYLPAYMWCLHSTAHLPVRFVHY